MIIFYYEGYQNIKIIT